MIIQYRVQMGRFNIQNRLGQCRQTETVDTSKIDIGESMCAYIGIQK